MIINALYLILIFVVILIICLHVIRAEDDFYNIEWDWDQSDLFELYGVSSVQDKEHKK